jgi:hypothetical protein
MPQLVGPVSPNTVAVRPAIWKKLRKVAGYMEEYVKDYKSPEGTGFFLAYVTRDPGGEGFHFLAIDGKTVVYKSYGGEGRKYFSQVLQREFNKYFSARNNPLVIWQNNFKGSPSAVPSEIAGMVQSTAAARFREAFAECDRVLQGKGMAPFRLSVIIVGQGEAPQDYFRRARDLGLATKSLVAIQGLTRPPNQAGKLPRGDVDRITPFTPFNFFHRLEHVICRDVRQSKVDPRKGKFFSGNIDELGFIPTSVEQNYAQIYKKASERSEADYNTQYNAVVDRALFNTGIATKAARLGLLSDAREASADVFAKYVTSSKDARDFDMKDYEKNMGALPDDFSYTISELNDVFGAWAEIRAAYMAATLGMFIQGYYTGKVPEVDIPLSELTAGTSIPEMEPEEHMPYEFSEEDARSTALRLIDLTRRGPEPRPGLFFHLV